MLEKQAAYAAKRRFKRADYASRIGFFHEGQYQFAEARVLGEGGMLFNFASPIEEGAVIEVHFYVTEGDFVDVHGKVLYNKKDSVGTLVGIEFVDVTPLTRRAIQKFIRESEIP